ncbi:hypothetical protein FF011L_49690 [Roseimaritima multifibrata]|uniref:Uncharacterized protein n=1 Tax=Roseimaritima multifibrata TaxID=1930274 RepID=A0A517MMR1_9BACT|nr:hypothetical protein [Roseimaritima multifibrata]QDS96161.1 hypothetical protein FF011L_49690 [Roseimaritima multifibrata]
MSEQNYRTIGAISGLVLGMVAMRVLGFGGMIPGAVFGAGGAVLGAMAAERVFRRTRR